MNPTHQNPWIPTVLPFGLTIFLSAFLLFEVQPMIAKYILPWFGGAPAVWTTCMLFFQAFLLAGYAYAHGISSRLNLRRQAWIHIVLLAASLLVLAYLGKIWGAPITVDPKWRPDSYAHPVRRILALLTISIGLPYFILASTAPLLQNWHGRRFSGISPYRLYALSNLGSLLALVGYPFLIEWLLPIKAQAQVWSWMYAAFALSCGYCALGASGTKMPDGQIPLSHNSGEPGNAVSQTLDPPKISQRFLWLALTACGSTMLLATTNQLCLSVAAVPLLWLLPLCLYLLSFILCFHNERWYQRAIYQPAFALGTVLAIIALYHHTNLKLLLEIPIYSLALFASCMVCHGELVRLRPAPRHLTEFYLLVALGGALGGVFVGVVAPAIFRGYWEYHLGLWGSGLLMLVILWRDRASWLYHSRSWLPILVVVGACLLPVALALSVNAGKIPRDWRLPVMVVLATALIVKLTHRSDHETTTVDSPDLTKFASVAALLMLGGILFIHARKPVLESARNFYGVLSVTEYSAQDPQWHAYGLTHGPILHGTQFQEPSKRRLGATYYGKLSAVGLVVSQHPKRRAERPEDRPLRIGTVGLGTGTIAVYAEPGDYLRFYEINPDVIRLASSRYFSYLRDCPGRVDVIEGDARLSMQTELQRREPQQFDILILDAFAGDAIPVHLLTREAFEIYLQHLRNPDGLMVVHISNSYVDLRPVLWKAAKHFALQPAWFRAPKEGRIFVQSDWVVLALNRRVLDVPEVAGQIRPAEFGGPASRLWTDDYSNLITAFKH